MATAPNTPGSSGLDATVPTQLPTPLASPGFGPREAIDARRQAQFSEAADAPVDVNFNSVVCRSQALTVDTLGKSYESNTDMRQKLQDRLLAKMTPA